MKPDMVAAQLAASPSRLGLVRARFKERGVDVLLVRATDRYLNEYVPDDESTRLWLTGFSGSAGDALVFADALHLFVDGRYTLQASQEVPDAVVTTAKTGQSIEGAWLDLLAAHARGLRVGVESDRLSVAMMRLLSQRAAKDGWTLVPLLPSPVEEVRGPLPPSSAPTSFWPIEPALAGRSVRDRLALGAPLLDEHDLHGLLVCALDELAWITNLRGDQFPYQATLRATALVTRDLALVDADTAALRRDRPVEDVVSFVEAGGLWSKVSPGMRLGIDPSTTPHAVAEALLARGAVLIEVQSPYALLRTKKTAAELAHMQAAFARADGVIDDVQRWLAKQLGKGRVVTEAGVAQKTEELFRASGAFGLSFKVISAAGANGAVIHYSTPDPKRRVKKGEIFLLDTGAYYEGGYATDLTRTFLAGPSTTKATKQQQRLYTAVLKAAIAGMSARVPVGVTGEQLDCIVREQLWRFGLDYGHGTGHGVGVNVHEAPPSVRIGNRGTVEPGQVFSIEPGVYLPGWGGIRIENLCTVVADPVSQRAGVPRAFLRVKPLTFSPLDRRLVDRAMLTPYEKRFLAWFARGSGKTLPPTA
ncbi:MAG: M24 family metallopeptidase [Deltaproteobacteria bacterium]|nr:M24 family metallopeptidase [Deltaproteobacteria bacterium]